MRTMLTASVVWIALMLCFIAAIGAFPACAQDPAGVVPAIQSAAETAPNTAPSAVASALYLGGKLPPLAAGLNGLTIPLAEAPQYLRPEPEAVNSNPACASQQCNP
jgi:hypothetical protein